MINVSTRLQGHTKAEQSSHFQVSYIWQKGSIVGPAWKAPFIGPFLSSMNPKWEEYKGKWDSGELSCVSVFHKYVRCGDSPRW